MNDLDFVFESKNVYFVKTYNPNLTNNKNFGIILPENEEKKK